MEQLVKCLELTEDCSVIIVRNGGHIRSKIFHSIILLWIILLGYKGRTQLVACLVFVILIFYFSLILKVTFIYLRKFPSFPFCMLRKRCFQCHHKDMRVKLRRCTRFNIYILNSLKCLFILLQKLSPLHTHTHTWLKDGSVIKDVRKKWKKKCSI